MTILGFLIAILLALIAYIAGREHGLTDLYNEVNDAFEEGKSVGRTTAHRERNEQFYSDCTNGRRIDAFSYPKKQTPRL